MWHPNGQIASERNYKDGNWISETRYRYYGNDRIKSKGNYKGGQLNGKWTEWYPNGLKTFEGYYKDGKKDGKWTEWYENGQIKTEANFKNDKPHGKWTEWNENGQIVSEKYYIEGNLVSGNTTEPPPPNMPPTAVLDPSQTTGPAPLTVFFNLAGSTDSDGTVQQWDLTHPGATSFEQITSTLRKVIYNMPGDYIAELRVKDDDGAESEPDTVTIVVTEPPPSNDTTPPTITGV